MAQPTLFDQAPAEDPEPEQTRPVTPTRDEWRATVLTAALDFAVPLRIAEMANWAPEARIKAAREGWATVMAGGKEGLSGGADLLFGGKHCAAEFNHLAVALAALAYQPGGVTVFGMHWCTNHLACLHAAAAARRRLEEATR